MDQDIIAYAGKKLYKLHIFKERKRYLVFRLRCWVYGKAIKKHLAFFAEKDLRERVLLGEPSFLEQATRGFFYKASTVEERMELIQNHLQILENSFQPAFLEKLYVNKETITLWQEEQEGKQLSLELGFNAGQRKEGCLSLNLLYDGSRLYQIMFWLNYKDNKPLVYIGALQGMVNGGEIVKALTKAYFGYRTKNLIFYGLRSLASYLGIDKIYAVGNEGYYAMNHIRLDRKLKTDFGAFWQECEGQLSEDKRFYVMPVAEYRKAMEELKPSKRAQHRRRFAKLDEITASVHEALQPYSR